MSVTVTVSRVQWFFPSEKTPKVKVVLASQKCLPGQKPSESNIDLFKRAPVLGLCQQRCEQLADTFDQVVAEGSGFDFVVRQKMVHHCAQD